MHRDFQHSQPARGNDVAESKVESLRTEIHGLESPNDAHRETKSSAPSHPYLPPKNYRAVLVSILSLGAVVLFILWRWLFAVPAWEGLVQPAQSRILNASHAGRWTIADDVRLGQEVSPGKLIGRVEKLGLQEAIATKGIEVRAAEESVKTLRESAAKQADARAAAIVDHEQGEITRAELTDVEVALRDVRLRLDLAVSSLAAVRADLERLDKERAREQIVAPLAGDLLLLNTRSEGAYVPAGELLAEVGSADLLLHFDVPESQVASVKTGDRVGFSFPGSAKQYPGTVERIEPRVRQEERGPLRERMRYGCIVVRPEDPLPPTARPGLLVTGRQKGWLHR